MRGRIVASGLLEDARKQIRVEQHVDDWIGGGVERRHALNKRTDGDAPLRHFNVTVNVQKVPDKVGAPAKHECCKQCKYVVILKIGRTHNK